MPDWVQIGELDVDAGVCWIGDPCYILSEEAREEHDWLQSWEKFCDFSEKLEEAFQKHTPIHGVARFPHTEENLDRQGLGITVSTGYGDGTYPVYVKRVGNCIAEVKIVFIEPEEEDNGDYYY